LGGTTKSKVLCKRDISALAGGHPVISSLRRTGYEAEFPTQGDLAREQLRRRGVLYFGDVAIQVRNRLDKLPPEHRKAFAVSCAEHLMRWHESLASPQSFALSWRPVIESMWGALADQLTETTPQVVQALEAFKSGPFNHEDGPDGPQDADDHAAAASIYAAECFMSGETQWAFWAASRGLDRAFEVAVQELDLDLPSSRHRDSNSISTTRGSSSLRLRHGSCPWSCGLTQTPLECA
jgi:hypothetical protein